MRTIFYDIHDLRFTEETKKELIAHIQSVEKTPENAESPISAFLDFDALKGSGNPEARSLAEVLPRSQKSNRYYSILDLKVFQPYPVFRHGSRRRRNQFTLHWRQPSKGKRGPVTAAS
jgi:hypothetical protein